MFTHHMLPSAALAKVGKKSWSRVDEPFPKKPTWAWVTSSSINSQLDLPKKVRHQFPTGGRIHVLCWRLAIQSTYRFIQPLTEPWATSNPSRHPDSCTRISSCPARFASPRSFFRVATAQPQPPLFFRAWVIGFIPSILMRDAEVI
jgi:hypothetical protein